MYKHFLQSRQPMVAGIKLVLFITLSGFLLLPCVLVQAQTATPEDKEIINISSTAAIASAAAIDSQTITVPATPQQPVPVTPFYQNVNNAAPKVGSSSHLFTVTLGLMVIIGLIFALSWFVKRFTQGAFAGNAHIKMLAAMPLGTRERLVLVETGGQQLLLGVTANSINTLHVLATPITITDKADLTSEFSKKLIAIMQQKMSAEPNTTTNSNNAG